MTRRLPAPNLTAVLAMTALGELIFYRVLNAAFLPAQPGTIAQRCLVDLGAFLSNLSGILGLLLAVVGLVRALGSGALFPRSMRFTVSTIALFFSALASMGVLWFLVTPRYQIHLRISHGFLVFFLMLGVWRGSHALRAKVAITLFALPMVLDAIAIFLHRMSWTWVDPGQIMRFSHAVTWAAMCAASVLLAPRIRRARHLAITLAAGILFGGALGAVTALRFDLVQAVAFYGLRVDLTGMSSSAEQLYTAALIVALASLVAAAAGCLAARGPARLVGWGLLLLAVSGQELSSAKPALFTLCGLLALVMGTAPAASSPALAEPRQDTDPQPAPTPRPEAGVPTQNG
jgi:hypothetical protein